MTRGVDVLLATWVSVVALMGIVMAVVALTAPQAGTIQAVWLEPAHEERYQSGSVCAGYNQDGQCTFPVALYSTRQVPDRCWVQIRDTERSGRTNDIQVGCDEREGLVVGAWYGR